MADEALIDAPSEVEDAAQVTDNAQTGSDYASEGQENAEGATENEETSSSNAPLRGSALWRETKALAQSGKPLTPKILSALNKVIHRSEAIESKYPDGLSAMEGQMAAVKQLIEDESIPFEQAIESTLQERNYFRELDDLFTNGKPEFVEKMAEASPEAFQNIAPAVFRKYAEVNPEGYSAYVAQAVQSHMDGAGVPLQFRILQAFLPQLPDGPAKDQVLSACEALYGWSESLKALANKKIEQKALPNSQNGNNGQDPNERIAQLEAERTIQSWNESIRDESINFVRSEATKAAGKQILTEKEHQRVLAMVKEEYTARLIADRRYGEAASGYVRAGNRNSYIQRVQSEQKKLIPGAVRRAVADVIEARPKAAPKEASKSGALPKPGMKPVAGANQFKRIAGPPRTLGMSVDLNKTTHTMLANRQAILMDGSKVQWGPLARA